MCGIIGYCGPKPTARVLLEGLKRLEYRGYDSAGIATVRDGALTVIKRAGKIKDLEGIVPQDLDGEYGIGHTRWATHGGVTDTNAHPHVSQNGKIAVVHNGIIENFQSLKETLEERGYRFVSETDSEVLAHLIEDFYEGSLEEAVKRALSLVKGTYGLLCVHADEPQVIVGARNGSPLVLGVGEHEMFLASDVSALLGHTRQVVYLEDNEVVRVTPEEFLTTDLRNTVIDKKVELITWELEEIEKGPYQHYMLKEIFEQPESIKRAMQGRIDEEYATAHLGGLNMTSRELLEVEQVVIIGAGTSYYAGMLGAYVIEQLARIPAVAELSSEIRYRNPVVRKNTLYFAVSQSGETADTLYALRELKRKGARVLGICNVVGSSIPRESDGGVYIHSGPEIAVASTKAFTSQVTAFYLFALLMARMRHLSYEEGLLFIRALREVPERLREVLEKAPEIKALARKYAWVKNFLFLGRGLNYPVALEGALKLKEVSYIHAEGYSAAEIKHGPIALINPETPSVFLVPHDELREKVLSNMKEVKSRGGKVVALCTEGDPDVREIADDVIEIPAVYRYMYPYLMVVPLQLFAYYMALELGRDVDQPRNLAKSVTVE
ncbi:Glucosamine--fructose-6-phosphate aminotransferase (isomerizing) [Spirochaeta thermophila DSM 6578]|uniref:Glutamine--fructose-6-phosphate aminotransferase [isomerizing] n=1 Tax=Winmispira thermophila (strain ATCC 700085 / DSM 6578 / Z-1203) TaxID=869211 RepID=G0GCP1_WINT7|nr:glutamine--fructose-6-phosphate transaminase (isomerizing) [Spirochaeta thermophila]AEJ60460.1 Glucosamine--fructose-6-phosphate aminotransferase (isomerizing) [Spirochaeta thermophila DSM 6578]